MESPPATRPYFFAVSILKLAVMSLATAGLYQLFWFYKHWQVIRGRTGERLSPPLRALFNVLFVYPLFRRISQEAPPKQVSPLLLAIVFVAIGVASLLPLPEPWSFVGLLAILPLLEAQSQANQVNERRTPEAPTNRRFTWANVVGLTVCAGAWTMIISGLAEARRDPGSPVSLKMVAVTAQLGLPRAVEHGVQLVTVADAPRQLTYTYRVSDDAAPRFGKESVRDDTRRAQIKDACERPEVRRLLDAKVTLRHVYRTRADASLFTLTVTGADCPAARASPAPRQLAEKVAR